MVLLVQNFLNFFVNTFFWLTYIPFYERITPIFVPNKTETVTNDAGDARMSADVYGFKREKETASQAPKEAADVPAFNVTSIYYNTFSPEAIATQLLQVSIFYGDLKLDHFKATFLTYFRAFWYSRRIKFD